MKKILSLFVSFAVFASCVPPVQGQQVRPLAANEDWKIDMGVEALPADTTSWPETYQKKLKVLDTHLQEEVNSADDKLLAAGEKLARKECRVRGLQCVSEKAFKALRQADWKAEDGQVCSEDKKQCVSLLAFAQGSIHWALNDLLYYQGEIVVEEANDFTGLVVTYGVNSEQDRQKALNYFYALAQQAQTDCGKSALEWGSASRRASARQQNQRSSDRCSNELAGLYGMAMLSKTAQENQKAVQKISALLNDKYDSSAAGLIIPGAATALATVGTAGAYQALYQFLMEESVPSLAGDLANISFKTGAQNVLRASSNIRGGNSRYLNRINEQFQYLDEAEAARQGYGSTSFQHEGLQYPYGNMLEDVGRLLGEQSAANKNADRVARQIIEQANNYVKTGTADGTDRTWLPGAVNAAGKIHYPVVLGILDGWQGYGKKFAYAPSPELLNLFYKGDWWDINEGTQQRVHYKAWRFAKARGWTWKQPVKDKQKAERYTQNARLLNVGEAADVALMPVFLTQLAASLPAMARSLASTVRWMQANRKFIGMRLVPASSKAAGTGKKVTTAKQAVSTAPVRRTTAATPRLSGAEKVRPSAASASSAARPAQRAALPQTPAQPAAAEVPAVPKATTQGPKLSALSRESTDNSLFGALKGKMEKAAGQPAVDPDADLARFLDGQPLIARGVNDVPKSGGFFSRLFKSKTQKVIDDVTAELNNLPQDAAGKMQKLQQLQQHLTLDQATVSKASVEEMRALANLKWKVASQMRSAQQPGIEIVGQATKKNPGIEIVQRSAAKKPAAPPPAVRQAAAEVKPAARSGAVQTAAAEQAPRASAVSGSAARTANAAAGSEKAAAVQEPKYIFEDAVSAEVVAPRGWSNAGRVEVRFKDGSVQHWTVNDYELTLKASPKDVQARLPKIESPSVRVSAAEPAAKPAAQQPAVRQTAAAETKPAAQQPAAGQQPAVKAAPVAQPAPRVAEASAKTAEMPEVTKIDSFTNGVDHYRTFSSNVEVSFKDGSKKVLSSQEVSAVIGNSSPQVQAQWLQAQQADLVRGATSLSRNPETGAVTLRYSKAGRTGRRTLSAQEYNRLRSGMKEPYLSSLQDLEVNFVAETDRAVNLVASRQKSARLKELIGQMKKARTPGAKEAVREEALPIIEQMHDGNALSQTDYLYLKLYFQ